MAITTEYAFCATNHGCDVFEVRSLFYEYDRYCADCYRENRELMDYKTYFELMNNLKGISPVFDLGEDVCTILEPQYKDHQVIDLKEIGSSLTPRTATSYSFNFGDILIVRDAGTFTPKFYFCKSRRFNTKEELIADMNRDRSFYSADWRAGV